MADALAPWALIKIAVDAKFAGDREKLGVALSKLAAEDPALSVLTDLASGQTILQGESEAHLDAKVAAVRSDYGLAINFGAPQVAYRETVTSPVQVDYTHKRIAGPKAQFARVQIRAGPNLAGPAVAFESMLPDGAMPTAFVSGVEAGVRSAAQAGVLAGFPVVGVKVELIDGAFHEEDSSALTFEIAARAAVREAFQKGGAVLLEPVMAVEVETPEQYAGAVVGDLKSRRGDVQSQVARGSAITVTAEIPLANMLGYVNSLRSFTCGAGAFTMRFARYAPVPTPDDVDPPPAAASALRA